MTNSNSSNHPDLDTLLAFSENRLAEAESEGVGNHIESCAQCRLEIKCFLRFKDMGEDPLEEKEVQWDHAELALERTWREKIQPSISSPKAVEKSTLRNPLIWLVPVAAAAALALIFLGPTFSPDSYSPPTVSSVIRGAEETKAVQITLDTPSGQQESMPGQFFWKTDTDCEHFTFEIFTSDLKTVFVASELKTPSWTMTEEVTKLLNPETIYLWNVRGFNQLKPVAESGNNWFRFPKQD